MRSVSKLGVVLAVALLVAGLAAPASAKKGGKPGAPSGTGLEVTVETAGYMWANSVGDAIRFDVTVTNSSGGVLEDVALDFEKLHYDTYTESIGRLDSNASWSEPVWYEVASDDFFFEDGTRKQSPGQQSLAKVGTIVAKGWVEEIHSGSPDVTDSEDAIMTAYPIPSCPVVGGVITFSPTEYSECSFTASAETYWLLTTTLAKQPRGRSHSPSATVRDGVPGNWCMDGDPIVNGRTVYETVKFPEALPEEQGGDIWCALGGAGGEPIPVRNDNTFYLATWAGNEVTAESCGTDPCTVP